MSAATKRKSADTYTKSTKKYKVNHSSTAVKLDEPVTRGDSGRTDVEDGGVPVHPSRRQNTQPDKDSFLNGRWPLPC